MRCVVSSCYNDDLCAPEGITFHVFPTDPLQCMAWLKALGEEDCKPNKASVICSNHFIKSDLYVDQNGESEVRAGAIPMVNLMNFSTEDNGALCDIKVCRICFATDCKLFQMNRWNKLDRAYKTLTGLTLEHDDNLPSYLCMECAQRLLNCVHFRDKSLRAHLMLLETIKKHDHITPGSLNATIGDQSLFKSHLSIIHMPIDHYDLKIEYKECDKDDTNNIGRNKITDMIDATNLDRDVMCRIKTEVVDTEVHDYDETVIAVGIKIENGILDKDILNNSTALKANCLIGSTEVNLPTSHKLPCEICPYETTEEFQLNQHLKSHATVSEFICDKCDYSTDNRQCLEIHQKVHSVEKKKRSCPICKKVFNTPGNLLRHLRIHSGEKPFSCDMCKKTFKRQDHYKTHLKVHSNVKPYSCDICNKEFSRQDHYKTHLKVHSVEKSCYVCDVCKKLFSRKSNLQNHMILHSGEKPYSCKICNKTFRRNNNLQKHLQLHRKKPYSCDLCRKCFREKSKLKIHIHRHSKNTAQICNNCNKVFFSKTILLAHLQKHCGYRDKSAIKKSRDTDIDVI